MQKPKTENWQPKNHTKFFLFFFTTMKELLADSLLSWLMISNQFGVGRAGLWVEGGLAGKICLHIWLPLNELEPDASTHFSDPSQHMGELVSPVWNNYIQNSWTCNRSRKLPSLRAWAKCAFISGYRSARWSRMLTPISPIHCNIWASLYLQFEAIVYRTRWLATNHENCLMLSYLVTTGRVEARC